MFLLRSSVGLTGHYLIILSLCMLPCYATDSEELVCVCVCMYVCVWCFVCVHACVRVCVGYISKKSLIVLYD